MKKIKKAGIVIIMALVGYGIYFYYEYKGVLDEAFIEATSVSSDEFENYIRFMLYFTSFLEKMDLDENGKFGFNTYAREHYPQLNNFEKGKFNVHMGKFSEAIEQIETDIKENGETEDKLFWQGIAYMRSAESQNCLSQIIGETNKINLPSRLKDISGKDLIEINSNSIDHKNHNHAQFCSLPIKEYHKLQQGSNGAIRVFKRLLDNYDSDNKLYRWLLNFSYMTLNQFPQSVPAEYLIKSDFIDQFYGQQADAMRKKYSHLSFADQATILGVDTLDAGKGVAVEDFDRDGFLDIVAVGLYSGAQYYKNEGGVRFVEKTKEVGLGAVAQNHIISAADYDNDGWMDLFFSTPSTYFRLYRNNRDGTFTDVTFESGLLTPPVNYQDTWIFTWGTAWGDVDNDGDLDLFIGQRGQNIPLFGGYLAKDQMDSMFFLNENGKFIDKTKEYGLTDIIANQGIVSASFGDYDDDGYADLFLSTWTRTKSVLLHNVKGKRFEATNLMDHDKTGFMSSFLDLNHDGHLDLYQAGAGLAYTVTDQAVFGADGANYANSIYINENGRFTEKREYFRGNMHIGSMGVSYGDINNDGCYDFYVGTGDPEAWHIMPNLMYVGETKEAECTGYLDNISMLHGFGTIQKGHGIVFFDFDNDGDQDIYSALGGMWPADIWPNQLFVNDSAIYKSWVKLRLRGRDTNYYGIGAKIKVTATGKKGKKIIRHYHMDNKTGFGSAPYLAHIGLMDAVSIKTIEVSWPASRQKKVYNSVELNKLTILDENDGMIVGLNHTSLPKTVESNN
ncbi:hypothetical protein MNBD_GAMMA21-1576 [hydrothermal vent metagenome]|uniref:ASPIC/UnbV domain-containing protein n=1 Tax=hydrothermal vent metagenome TaxID=652676 RepID=A0A3B1A7W6_9ZZZZ